MLSPSAAWGLKELLCLHSCNPFLALLLGMLVPSQVHQSLEVRKQSSQRGGRARTGMQGLALWVRGLSVSISQEL